jgi:PAS domain S-box-containing protein
VLAAAAAVAQAALVPTGGHHGFAPALAILGAAALLLPPQLVALVPLAQHLSELAAQRYRPHIWGFNTANDTLAALAAWGAAELVGRARLDSEPRWAAAAVAAAVVLVVANHVGLAVMLRVARDFSIRSGGLFAPSGLLADFALAGLGAVVARLWLTNAYLIPLAVAPLLLTQRSFRLVARLGESESRFRALFEGAPIGTALLDLDASVLSSNPVFDELLGYPPGDLVGRPYRELRADQVDADDDPLSELLAGRRERYGVERRLRRADGTVAVTQVELALVRDVQRRPSFAIAMFEDLTERKQLEERLRHAQRLEAVGQLAGGVAHDFNNLLTIILGRTRFALRALGADDAAGSDLVEVEEAAERAAALTQQLLAFGRRQVLQPRVLDVNAVVTATTRMLRRLIGEDIELVVELAPDAGYVQCDPGQLEQVIVNLVVNARDAMEGGGRLTIRTGRDEPEPSVEGEAPHEYVTIAVADTGHGMDAATQAHIFEPFFTTKEAGKGTGLGLATVHGIVGQSGGHLRVESELGAGSTFTVCLLRATAEDAADDEPRPLARVARGSETVLLVEDDDGVRALAQLLLTEAGYTILVERNGREALLAAERHEGPIDLLVTDLVMPGLSGVELADAVTQLRPGLRVVFMSGYSDSPPTPGAEPFTFVPKPFSEDALLQTVRQVLDADQIRVDARRAT